MLFLLHCTLNFLQCGESAKVVCDQMESKQFHHEGRKESRKDSDIDEEAIAVGSVAGKDCQDTV